MRLDLTIFALSYRFHGGCSGFIELLGCFIGFRASFHKSDTEGEAELDS